MIVGTLLPKVNNKIRVAVISYQYIEHQFVIEEVIQIFPSFSRFKIWLKENFHYGFNATNGQIGWNNRYSDRVLEYIN